MRKFLTVKVIPESSSPGVVGQKHGILKVKVSSPPTRGKANEELILLVADYFNVERARVKIVAGRKSPLKRLFIEE